MFKPKITKRAAVNDLRNVCVILPGCLYSLKNDIVDLEAICLQLIAIPDRIIAKLDTDANASIHYLISQAKRTLLERLDMSSTLDVQPLEKENTRLQHLQGDIKTIKCSLGRFLGASFSYVY